jgi:hypothetical protein
MLICALWYSVWHLMNFLYQAFAHRVSLVISLSLVLEYAFQKPKRSGWCTQTFSSELCATRWCTLTFSSELCATRWCTLTFSSELCATRWYTKYAIQQTKALDILTRFCITSLVFSCLTEDGWTMQGINFGDNTARTCK